MYKRTLAAALLLSGDLALRRRDCVRRRGHAGALEDAPGIPAGMPRLGERRAAQLVASGRVLRRDLVKLRLHTRGGRGGRKPHVSERAAAS